jgi:hypothetical protein
MEMHSFEVDNGDKVVGLIFNDETAKSFIKHMEMAVKDVPRGKDGCFYVTFLAGKIDMNVEV